MEKVVEDASLEFEWLEKKSVGGKGKQITFYRSFIYDGVKYELNDCVYMHKEGLPEPYIGKLTKMWAQPDNTKKVKVQWFFRPEEISKWLGDTKTLENEIFLASGEGVGLANINPLEAIAGRCNVVCVSKDKRNPQPSDEELKAADFVFYRTFDVKSCTILDKMDEEVGGLEIEKVFNRKEGENISSAPESTSDRKEESQNTTTSSEGQQLLAKSLPNKVKEGKEDIKLSVAVDVKGDSQDKDITSLMVVKPSSGVDPKQVDETNSDMGETDSRSLKADRDHSKLKDMPFSNDKADKDEMQATIVPIEAKERNKRPIGTDKSHDLPIRKVQCDDKRSPKEKQVETEVALGSDILEHEDKLLRDVANVEASGASGTNSELGKTDSCNVKVDKDNLKLKDKDKADNNGKKVSMVPVHKVGSNKRNNASIGSDELPDRPLKKVKSDDKTNRKEKQLEHEVAGNSERLTDMPSKKSKDDNSLKLPVKSKSKQEDKLTLHVNSPKALGTSDKTEEKPYQKNGKVLGSDKGKSSAKVMDDFEGGIKKNRADGSLKKPDDKKKTSIQQSSGSDGKDLVAASMSSEGKPNPGLASGTNKESKVEQSGEGKRKLSMSRSPKGSTSSTDREKKYKEFVVSRKPNAEKSGWFRRLPWEERLKNAYEQGSAVLLHNLDPDYTSEDVEDIIWHAFNKEHCEAKILPRTAVSSPHYGQALIIVKNNGVAQRIISKLDEECLMLSSNGRPLVGTTCPPISPRKSCNFFGHLVIDKIRVQNQREMDEAVSTSHFSQPNTIEYDMAMEWCLLQSRSKKWWETIHKQQGEELRKLRKKGS